MDDTLRNLAIGLFAFLGLHGALHERVRLAAQNQVSEAFAGQGTIRVSVAPRGFFGLETNDLSNVDVDGRRIRMDHLPFYVFPRQGWKGRIHHLRLHFSDFTLRGLHVEEFRADIPRASYDLGHAFYHNRLVLRGAGDGTAVVHLNAEDLTQFVLNKYKKTLSDVYIVLENHKIVIQGTEVIFGTASFRAIGAIHARGGRFLDIDPDQTVLSLNGKIVDENTKNSILRLINPVVDIEDDLGLGGYFVPVSVEIDANELSVIGRAYLPSAPLGMKPP